MASQGMVTVEQAATMIRDGRILLLAGDEALLAQLPSGTWIGGTSANFMTVDGGVTEQARLFFTDLTDYATSATVSTYSSRELAALSHDYPDNGFTAIILPGMSETHATFGRNAHTYPGLFNTPLVGWISGVHVNDIGARAPKVFAGNGTARGNLAAAIHVTLPPYLSAEVEIVNLFEPGDGATIEFDQEGFSVEAPCRVNGETTNLAAMIADKALDTRLPLVANYNGAMINVAIQSVDTATGTVRFYGPVFRHTTYRFARPVDDYIAAFQEKVDSKGVSAVAFSCNCILNYLYAGLEGKKTEALEGPMTFGEIAYILLNQTLVYLTIRRAGYNAG